MTSSTSYLTQNNSSFPNRENLPTMYDLPTRRFYIYLHNLVSSRLPTYSKFQISRVQAGGQGCPPHKRFDIFLCTSFTYKVL
jgi:hypothetical protein